VHFGPGDRIATTGLRCGAMIGALEGLRVLELGGEIAAPYATKLLCELGADVCKVEPLGGDPLRTWQPVAGSGAPAQGATGSVLFRSLNGGKRSAVIDLDTPAGAGWLRDAAAGADLLVESLGPGRLEALLLGPDVLQAANPRMAIVRISEYGQSGPRARIPSSGLVVQAHGGWVSNHGVPDQPPVAVGARIHEYTAGTFAAAAALSAWRAARAGASSVVVDLSVMECLVATLPYPHLVLEDTLAAGMAPAQGRWFPLPGIRRCRDGWVGINALTGQHFLDACAMLGVDDCGPRLQEIAAGGRPLEEFFARIQPWLDERDAQDIVEVSQAFRVPAAPVGDGRMMLEYAQFAARPFFVEEDDIVMPGPPYRLHATPASRRGRAPALGDLGAAAPVATAGAPRSARPDAPLAGLTVVDLGTFWAGPYCTMYLGALGADVIKVESTRRPDGFRFSGAFPQMGDDWYDRGGIFAGTNLDKREVTLDLSTEKGRALLLRLVERADVVLENFSARVVEHFDLGYGTLRAVRPDVVMVRMPGFGLEGPWRDYVGWAMVIEQATGMASVTGPGDLPMHPGGLADPVIGMHAAVAIQAALEHRDRTGEGQLIEVAQLETGANVTAELVVEWSAHRRALPRLGNRDPHRAPQGVYACSSEGPTAQHVAITVADDGQWRAFAARIGRDDLLSDARFETEADRREHHDELDAAIAAWVAQRSAADVVAAIRPLGVAVASLLQVPTMCDDEQLGARGFYQQLDHALTGVRRYPGWPMRWSFLEQHHRRGAPTLGEHNREILTELGLDADEIAALERDGVIGTRMQMPS
jgi:crotonobetainyl-CoA:carnitine CoA-transferase CaiB-like acyl-CoA transferase